MNKKKKVLGGFEAGRTGPGRRRPAVCRAAQKGHGRLCNQLKTLYGNEKER